MTGRFKDSSVSDEVASLVRQDPGKAADVPEALDYFLGSAVGTKTRNQLRVEQLITKRTFVHLLTRPLQHLVYWAPVSPIAALRYFLPAFNTEPLVVQYAMRTLEQHPIDLVFFYIPQVVQALRTDPLSEIIVTLTSGP
jgi:phosphatidylinositol 4-kinase